MRLVMIVFGIGAHFIVLLFMDKVYERLLGYIGNFTHVVLFIFGIFKTYYFFLAFLLISSVAAPGDPR